MSLDHPSVRRVSQALAAAGVPGRPVALAEPATTAAAAAAQLGCPVGAIANSLVFDADGHPLLVLTSGSHRVDASGVSAVLGLNHLAMADAGFVRRHTGMAIGGVAPVGHPRPIRTLVDVSLGRHDVVWAAAGHPRTVFPTSYGELLRITAGTSAVVG
jgi:prolyl-tRNA editing enzyme YbaK/EbsC (Cys-tRNA(Pro) deacylase)